MKNYDKISKKKKIQFLAGIWKSKNGRYIKCEGKTITQAKETTG